MCINVKVNLPIVESFLLLYSLRCGCILILAWTCVRSFLWLVFFNVALLEVFAHTLSVGSILIHKKEKVSEEYAPAVYITYLALLVGQAFLFVHTYYLALGLCYLQSRFFGPYLICRFVTWLIEIVCLFVLCLIHKLLIGWYLGMLMFVILEIYCFIVVYSYYINLSDYERAECDKMCCNPCESPT